MNRGSKACVVALLLAFFALLFGESVQAAPTITRKSTPIFYTDFGKSLTSMYVAYQVTNDGVARPNVWATISNLTGGSVALATNENGIVALGAMAAGESKLACFYLTASSNTTTAQGHTVTVLDNAPGLGATLASQSFSFTRVEDTIAANANKVNTTVTTPNPPSVGGIVTITVTGATGTIGAAQVLAFTPASYGAWRADALQLIATTISLSGGNTGTYTNTLLIPPGSLNSADTSYTAVYNFRIINSTGVNTPVSPVGYISSGTQVKHTDTGDFASLQPILPANNTTLLSKTVSPTSLTGGTATYTLRLTNSGPYDVQLDRIVDVLPSSPANATYVTGSATFSGTAFANPSISGQTLTWTGTFSIPAGASRDLIYQATFPNIGGSYVNRATAYIENTRIDSTTSTNDDAPAQATISVPTADVVVTKSGPATAFVGATFSYTVSYQNNGTDAAQNVVLRDTLPSQVTFVSATGGGTHSGGVVTWNLGSIANGATGSFTVTVRGASTGSAVNVASSSSDSYDPNTGNNDGTAATSKVTTTLSINADVAIAKTGPATTTVGVPFTYTITATNNGPSPAQNVVVSDPLPAGVTFNSATGGGTFAAGVVTWPTIATLASGASVSYNLTVTAPAIGSFTNAARSTATSADSTPGNNDGSAAASRVTTSVTAGYTVSGFVYDDANRNSRQETTETGTGLTLYVKLIDPAMPPANPALAVATVDPASGAFALPNVTPGLYKLVLDDNATLADTTPSVPIEWAALESSGGIRPLVAVANAPVGGQNFGLYHGKPVLGRVFLDTGTGGGTANNGAQDGGEGGLANVTVKLTDATGATTYSSATTDGSGVFALAYPTTLTTGTQLRIVETNLTGYISTGAVVGDTGGTYARATDTVTFTLTANNSYANVAFGDVPATMLNTDGAQTAMPGATIHYPHTFTAGTAGTVTFSIAQTPLPAIPGWSPVLYRDTNANGLFDTGEPQITAPIAVTAGQVVAVLVKEFVPLNAPFGAQNKATLTAAFTFANAPTITASLTRTDITTVGQPQNGALLLTKSVDKANALPGQTLTYTITYLNRGQDPLNTLSIHDATPAFSTFASAGNGPLPAGVTGVTLTAPSAGGTGAIRWNFTGTLAPGSTGTVSFTVTIDQ